MLNLKTAKKSVNDWRKYASSAVWTFQQDFDKYSPEAIPRLYSTRSNKEEL